MVANVKDFDGEADKLTYQVPNFGHLTFSIVDVGLEEDSAIPGVYLVAKRDRHAGWAPVYFEESAHIDKTIRDSRKLIRAERKFGPISVFVHQEPDLDRRKSKLRKLLSLLRPPMNE